MTNPPRRIGKFEILDRLGAGAMGEVFLARDAILGREVALKTIHPAALTAPDARDRFFREAQASGRLNHPNLVTVHEFGEDQGVLYLAMEFVPGDDLAQVLQARELAPKVLLELLAQVCDGLAFAHQRGILHRDIKPSNIRITRISGRLTAKVLDFGIARLAGSDLTATGALLGTFGYMAPEYIQSGKPDQRADVFAVGVILYEALAGFNPFGGETTATVLHRIVNEEPPPLDPVHLGGISPAIQGVLTKALAKAPGARYPTAEALAAALRAAQDPLWDPGTERATTQRSPLAFTMPARPAKAGTGSSRIWAFVLIPLVLAGAAFGGWRWVRRHRHAAPVAAAPAPQPAPPPQPAPAPAPADTTAQQPGPEAVPSPAEAASKPSPVPPQAAPPAQAAHTTPTAKAAAYASLNEAAAALDTDPKGALTFLEHLVQQDPENERALALLIVARYDTGDFKGCARAIHQARTDGHPLWPMALKYARLRKMLEQEKADPRLPRRKAEAAP